MAYIDYGGRAWQDDVLRNDRMDFELEVVDGDNAIGQAGLGNEVVHVLLYKGTTAELFVNRRLVERLHAGSHRRNGEKVGRNETTLDGHRVTVVFDLTENTDPGCYAEVVQPDGTRWTVWARHWAGNRTGEDHEHAEAHGRECDKPLAELLGTGERTPAEP